MDIDNMGLAGSAMISMDAERENTFLKMSIAQLKAELAQAKLEMEKTRKPPLLVCEVANLFGEKAVVKLANGNLFLVDVNESIRGKLSVKDTVLAEQRSLTILERIGGSRTCSPEAFLVSRKPTVKWSDIGGLEDEIRELKEAIELPLLRPDIFEKVGIEAPKGVLLHGPPGCGKTLLAKALANATNATFIEIVGSELVQKFIGEGAKLVKEIFQLAREKAPSIIFIDEMDAIASHRIDAGTSGDREVQRTFMQLLAEIDGFESLDNVKIIGATNRFDILDHALIRPGRLDRLIEIGMPDTAARESIFSIHTAGINMKKVSIEKLVEQTRGLSGADIRLVCTEAGYFGIRANRVQIGHNDFEQAIRKVKCAEENTDYKKMFS